MSANNKLFYLILLSVFLTACEDGSTNSIQVQKPQQPAEAGEDCQKSSDCAKGLKCQDGICIEKEPEKPKGNCGEKTCEPNEVCLDEECVDKSKLCGNVLCDADETCIDNECVLKSDLCNGALCGSDETCFMNKCRKKGDCGGIECNDHEKCIEDKCTEVELCDGVMCADDEICFEKVCMPKGDCGGIKCDEETQYCLYDLCLDKQICGDGYCEGDEVCKEGVCEPGPKCIVDATERTRCGKSCCEQDEFCGTREQCCPNNNACGNDCCQEGEVCENELCHIVCKDTARCELKDGTETCCKADQICVSNECFTPPEITCIDNYMCETDQFCDPKTQKCLPQPKGAECKADPTGGKVQPTLQWYWGEDPSKIAAEDHPEHYQVMSSPMVADMNNDTIPEVVFNTFSGASYQGNGIIRILNGKTGQLIASSDGNPMTDGGSQVALGDLDGDTIPEIVTCSAEYKLIVYKFDPASNKLTVKWKSDNAMRECGQGGPGIADFNGDGKPEVYIRYHVHDGASGALIGSQSCKDSEGAYDDYEAHAPCDYSVAADLNGDGIQELVGGAVAWKVDFTQKQLTPYYDRRDVHREGYPAIADINLDGKPEIFVVRSNDNSVMAFNADGTDHWPQKVSHSVGAGGPPTIANLDDTKQPELTFAGKQGYIVFDYTGKMLWTRSTHDFSSAKTGSSVFDFDGDGKAEVVYADEFFLRVYNGKDGKTVYCQCNTSGTHWEYPVIVDVNNDGHAEIVVSSNSSMIPGCPDTLPESEGWDECVDAIMKSSDTKAREATHGVRVFSSPNKDWVNTRKIYNQHAYSITNVSDNGTIPNKVRENWLTQNLNNFRLNVQPGANYLPDLEIANVSSPRECKETTPLYFNVKNVGWSTAIAGIPINIWYVNTNSEDVLAGTVKTTKDLPPGAYESIEFPFPRNETTPNPTHITLKFTEEAPTECRTDNNQTQYDMHCPIN